jgi:hypothetical protein
MRGRRGQFVAHSDADTHTCADTHADANEPLPEL